MENLQRIGKLKAHAADEQEIARVLESAERVLKDASVAALSADSRLDLAYRGLMQAALAAARLMREETAADVLLVDHEISPSQAFNLEKDYG